MKSALTYCVSLTKLVIPSVPAAILSDMATKTAGNPEISHDGVTRVTDKLGVAKNSGKFLTACNEKSVSISFRL